MNPESTEIHYNIHNKVLVRISTCNQDLIDECNYFFRYFNSEKKTAPLEYIIRDYAVFQIPPRNFRVNKYIIGFDHGFCRPKERYAVEITDNRITEYTVGITNSTLLWLQVLLTRQNLSLLHGAGVEINGKGIVLTGLSGSGKTSLITQLRTRAGFRFFTDEHLLLDKEGVMYSNPVDLTILEEHFALMPDLKISSFLSYFKKRNRIIRVLQRVDKFPLPRMLQRQKTYVLSELTRFWAGRDYVKLPATDLIPPEKIGTRTRIGVAFLLSRSHVQDITVKPVDLAIFIDKNIGMLNLQFKDYYFYMHILSSLGIFNCAEFERKQKEILSDCFLKVRLFEVTIPETVSPADLAGSILSVIDTLEK
jgi:hypothetical protein